MGYDLVRVRKTYKTLKALVDDSEMLQYIIGLSYFQMIRVGTSETGVPPATRLRQLRQHDAFSLLVGGTASTSRLPSASDSGDLYCWSHPISGGTFEYFTFCAAQDLLVVVTSSQDVVVINRGLFRDYLQMWDWKSKEGYQSKPPQCTAKLSLPSLVDDFSYQEVSTRENPTPGSAFPYPRKSHHQPSCSFHPTTNDQLITIDVYVNRDMKPNNSHLYRFLALCSAILELESSFSETYGQPTLNGPKLLWSIWGPQHTTWFKIREDEGDLSPYGFRTVQSMNKNPSALLNESSRLFDTTISHLFTEPLGSALAYSEIVSEELFDGAEALIDEKRILVLKRDLYEDLKNIDVLLGAPIADREMHQLVISSFHL
ncbi:uncharacterized protein EDB91DRAFT_1079296 [Suillus paluster]|uniref:uncharacterized protein n=1 Tax=Suillus paluster TaxID=48578 RepID=UPI001B86B700|nr:uncharacterized protein EDB91DRAFT_1079296 [Suillus paluster]KAG1748311.1 hypothetical protein EDB91DRAFT_1079296 [Suillus paluster]